MTRKEIIMVMGTSQMSNLTLFHELYDYVEVCLVEVNDMIRKGITGPLEKYVAWVLGLKKYIPAGWKPSIRIQEYKPKPDLPKQLTFDSFNSKGVLKGTDHYLNQDRFWKTGEIAKLKELYLAKKTRAQMSDTLGKTLHAIDNKILNTKGEW